MGPIPGLIVSRERIAQHPLEPRDAARLLVVDRQGLQHAHVKDLPSFLQPGDVVVYNDSRVVPARVSGRRSTGGGLDILVVGWSGSRARCMVRGRVRVGEEIFVEGVEARILGARGPFFDLDLGGHEAYDILTHHGTVPLPPYIKGPLQNPERYQTIFACAAGSVAAPTAGLHFTRELVDALKTGGVELCPITLHIGPSTFLPLGRNDGGEMPAEKIVVPPGTAEAVSKAGGEARGIYGVGTTSVKALEAAASEGQLRAFSGPSHLFIKQGYAFRVPWSGLLTNFHLPESSNLHLVCALGGPRIEAAYREALSAGYRFYTFGDAMLLRGLRCSK